MMNLFCLNALYVTSEMEQLPNREAVDCNWVETQDIPLKRHNVKFLANTGLLVIKLWEINRISLEQM